MSREIKDIINDLKNISREIEEESSFSGWLDKADRIILLAEELEKQKDDKICVITSGDYSSYKIDRVFKNKDIADIVASKIWDSKVEIYDIEDNLYQTKPHKDYYKVSGKYTFDVNFKDDNLEIDIDDKNEYTDDDEIFPQKRVYIESNQKCGGRVLISIYFAFKEYNKDIDKEKYLKILRDDMSQIKYLILDGYPKEDINKMMYANYMIHDDSCEDIIFQAHYNLKIPE